MTPLERAALESDRLAYGQLWRNYHRELCEARALREAHQRMAASGARGAKVLFHARAAQALREPIAAGEALASRVARASRDLHLELLGG